MAYVVGSPEHERAVEVRSYLDRNRRSLRALAIARCRTDNRLMAATYRFRDDYWLWAVGERSTPAETLQRARDWHEDRYFDALIDGVDPVDAGKLLWQPDGTEVVHSDQHPPSVELLRDPVGVLPVDDMEGRANGNALRAVRELRKVPKNVHDRVGRNGIRDRDVCHEGRP